MFRLIKLSLYALIGYVIYELYRGVMEGVTDNGGGGRRSRDLQRALNEDDQGRMGNLTGPGRGTTVTTEDFQGARNAHLVGRGVVSR